jgi:hypothetical protein
MKSRIFLITVAAVFIPVFALPLFADPVWWAERFGWDTEGPRDLVVYLGRCLGAVALAIGIVALRASRDPDSSRWLFDVLAIGGALLAIAHLRGLFESEQPLVEDLEVLMYAGFAAAAWLCRPTPARPPA